MYSILLGKESVGQAEIKEEGLYSRIHCRLSLSGDIPFQVIMKAGDREISLGTCLRRGSIFEIDTKVPRKYIGNSPLQFYAKPKRPLLPKGFVPIYPQEPFAYLLKLEQARMAVEQGIIGVYFTEEGISPQDSGQNP